MNYKQLLVKITSLIYEDYICYYFVIIVTSHTYVFIHTILFCFVLPSTYVPRYTSFVF